MICQSPDNQIYLDMMFQNVLIYDRILPQELATFNFMKDSMLTWIL